jgi:predicted transcriptional regulator
MKKVTLEVASRETTDARFMRAMESGEPLGAFITFPTVETMWTVLTAKRWEIVRALCGAGPMSLREAARRVGRDVKAVHTDAQALLKAGVLEKTADGQIVFPYDTVHVDFLLKAAA